MPKLPRYRINTIVRLFFLCLTPALFRWICPGFTWHSIFLASVTVVLMLWGGAVLLSPLFGRVPCGWICPFGTIQDLVAPVRLTELRRDHPLRHLRWVMLAAFLVSAFTLGPLGAHGSLIKAWSFSPFRLDVEFTPHYKYVWMLDAMGMMLLALFLGRRGPCRFFCTFGAACAVGARLSRLTPVVTEGCNGCGRCERSCPARVEIVPAAPARRAHVIRDAECLLCGLCADVCPRRAIHFRFAWREPAPAAAQTAAPRTMDTL